jgi:hypothetical protein
MLAMVDNGQDGEKEKGTLRSSSKAVAKVRVVRGAVVMLMGKK